MIEHVFIWITVLVALAFSVLAMLQARHVEPPLSKQLSENTQAKEIVKGLVIPLIGSEIDKAKDTIYSMMNNKIQAATDAVRNDLNGDNLKRSIREVQADTKQTEERTAKINQLMSVYGVTAEDVKMALSLPEKMQEAVMAGWMSKKQSQ